MLFIVILYLKSYNVVFSCTGNRKITRIDPWSIGTIGRGRIFTMRSDDIQSHFLSHSTNPTNWSNPNYPFLKDFPPYSILRIPFPNPTPVISNYFSEFFPLYYLLNRNSDV